MSYSTNCSTAATTDSQYYSFKLMTVFESQKSKPVVSLERVCDVSSDGMKPYYLNYYNDNTTGEYTADCKLVATSDHYNTAQNGLTYVMNSITHYCQYKNCTMQYDNTDSCVDDCTEIYNFKPLAGNKCMRNCQTSFYSTDSLSCVETCQSVGSYAPVSGNTCVTKCSEGYLDSVTKACTINCNGKYINYATVGTGDQKC